MQTASNLDIHAPIRLGVPADFFSKFSLNVNPLENSQGLSIQFRNFHEVQNLSTSSSANLISSNLSSPTPFVQPDIQAMIAQPSTPIIKSTTVLMPQSAQPAWPNLHSLPSILPRRNM